MDEIKKLIGERIDEERERLISISHLLHQNPELAFKEYKSVETLTDYLKDSGFNVEIDIAGLPTAFRAVYGSGSPVIGVLAEYDALPELGHACGHNIIGASAVGAGMAAKVAVDKYGGQVRVYGTPGEEGGGGKINMVEEGVFDDVDAVMMVHPSQRNVGMPTILSAIGLKVEYTGKEAHASSAPEEGINALDALITAYNAINAMRQHIRDSSRIHGIITDGGQVPNVVPARSAATFLVRAADNDYLEVLKKKVIDCFEAGASASGAKLSYEWFERFYAAMESNLPLVETFARNMELLGKTYSITDPDERFGSTDMGNVSVVVPAIHPSFSIDDRDFDVHTKEFCQAAAAPGGDQGVIDGAKAMAMTVADLLRDHDLLSRVAEYHSG